MDKLNKIVQPVISPPNKLRISAPAPGAIIIPPFDIEETCRPKRKKQKLGAPKNLWSPREDRILGEEVHKLGEKAWSEIAAKLPGRVGKQCRDRWRNHLCPEVKKGSWTSTEDKLLFEYREKLGNQWAEIAKHIPGRTDLSVKNRYYSYRRKVQRQEKRQQKVRFNPLLSNKETKSEHLIREPAGTKPPSDLSRGLSKSNSSPVSLVQAPLTTKAYNGFVTQSNNQATQPQKLCAGNETSQNIQNASAAFLPFSQMLNANMLNMNLLALCNMGNGLMFNDRDFLAGLSQSAATSRINSSIKFNPMDFNGSSCFSTAAIDALNRNGVGSLTLDSSVTGIPPGLLPHAGKHSVMMTPESLYKRPLCPVPFTEIKQPFA